MHIFLCTLNDHNIIPPPLYTKILYCISTTVDNRLPQTQKPRKYCILFVQNRCLINSHTYFVSKIPLKQKTEFGFSHCLLISFYNDSVLTMGGYH